MNSTSATDQRRNNSPTGGANNGVMSQLPDANGRFGSFGGRYVPETLVPALEELDGVYAQAVDDVGFWEELDALLRTFVGRATPVQRADRLTGHVRGSASAGMGATIWRKREDLAHTGAHKMNNTLGQAMLALRLGKRRIIAETGAGQHGVATARGALSGCHARCTWGPRTFVGAAERCSHAAARRGVVPVESGSRTLKDATNEAMRDWMSSVESTHYIWVRWSGRTLPADCS